MSDEEDIEINDKVDYLRLAASAAYTSADMASALADGEEAEELSHPCGDVFFITYTSALHQHSKDAPEDTDLSGTPYNLVVRAHDLPSALRKAASAEQGEWKTADEVEAGGYINPLF